MAAKITLGIIARNAADTIQECLESALPYVDEVIIGYGGQSTDMTEAVVEHTIRQWKTNHGPISGEIIRLDWHDDFARARNEVLDKATGDYFLWLDADDILVNGHLLRQYVEANPQGNCFWAPYHYDEDEHGNVSTYLWRERLVAHPPAWRWSGAVHEYLELEPSVPLALIQMPDVVVRHNPKRNKAKGERNLNILYRVLEREEPEPQQRTLLYLFRETAARGNLSEALVHANRYIARAEHDDEAYQMAVGVAHTLRAQGRYPEAQKAALRAMDINPTWPDAWYLMARMAYEQGDFWGTIEWTRAGGTKQPPLTSVIIDPRNYNYWPLYFLGLAYRGLGDWEMAAANLRKAAEILPDEQITGLILEAEGAQERDRVRAAFLLIHEHLARHDEWLKARGLFRFAPKELEQDPEVMERHLRTLASTEHVENPQVMVDFYRNNPAWQPMSDEMIWSEGWAQHPRMAFARKSITCDPPATILDLGPSDGFISLPLAKDGHIVEGFDLDPRCVDLANQRAQDLDLRAKYKVGSIEDVEGKYDVALAFEIIEHLVDPDAFLDKLDEHARKVVITTPYLAWEGGRIADWAKVEPKGHLRIFDLDDLEARIAHRGRIFDLYVEPYGRSAWIFASYRPRQEYDGSVTILAPGTLEEWSPRKRQAEGLGGSETAIIRLAEELFLGAHKRCVVYGRIDSPGYYNGVNYRPMDAFQPGVASDVLIAWRWPEAADLPVRAKRLILWMHDTDAGDRLTPVRAARFDHIVVLSEWHRQHMLATYPWLDPDKLMIIGNGVDLERFAPRALSADEGTPPAPQREPHRVAYTSSPDRGLDVILEHVWPKVVEQVPDAELHVYYGWKAWESGQLGPEQMAFRQKVANLLIDSKGVVQHGRIPQDQLAAELGRASVWLHPSHNFWETYCISAIEAQLAGAIPVAASHGALAETVAGGLVIQGTIGRDEGVVDQYAGAIVQVLTGDQGQLEVLRSRLASDAPAESWTEVSRKWLPVLGD